VEALSSISTISFFQQVFFNGLTVGNLNSAIENWWIENNSILPEYQRIQQQHFYISLDEFQELLSKSSYELACSYCRITEEQFLALIQAGQVQTKRFRTWGTSFEVDCCEPRAGYTRYNVTVCCYWCNNAKTDEFSSTEFQPVAQALSLVWKQRLAKVNHSQ